MNKRQRKKMMKRDRMVIMTSEESDNTVTMTLVRVRYGKMVRKAYKLTNVVPVSMALDLHPSKKQNEIPVSFHSCSLLQKGE